VEDREGANAWMGMCTCASMAVHVGQNRRVHMRAHVCLGVRMHACVHANGILHFATTPIPFSNSGSYKTLSKATKKIR
jgi:hypothetical protein